MIGRARRVLGRARRELRTRWVGRVTTVESNVAATATFADHRVVITGAAGILGRRLVAAFVAGGATVWAVDRAEEKLAALGASTPEAIPMLADLLDPDTVGRIIEAVSSAVSGNSGPVIVVHAAATGPFSADPLEVDRATWNTLFDEQVSGPVELTVLLVPEMRAAPGSSVVFISSINGVAPSQWPQYAAAKAGVVKVVEDFAIHFAGDGIRVNGVAPSRFQHGPDLAPNPKVPLTGRDVPVAAVVHAVLFLADARRSPLTTGVVLRVDGGQALRYAGPS